MIQFVNAYLFFGLPILLSLHSLQERNDSFMYHLWFLGNFVVIAIATALGLGANKRLALLRSPLFIISIIYLGYITVQTVLFRLTAEAILESKQLEGLATLALTLLPAVAAGLISFSWENLRTSLKFLEAALFALSATVFICVFLFHFGIEFGEVLELSALPTRYFGPIGDQIGFVSSLGVFIGLARSRWRMMSFHLVAVILTGTRGLLPVLGIGIVAYGYFLAQGAVIGSRSRGFIRLAGASILIGCVLFSPIGEIVTERITDRALLQAGLSTRGGSMMLGVEIFQDHPWFGVGYSGFTGQATARGAHLAFTNFNSVFITNPQNPYLDAAVSGGLIGLSIYLAVLWIAYRGSRFGVNHAPRELYPTLVGIQIWILAMIVGLHSACFLLPLSIILLFFTLSAMLLAATVWLVQQDIQRAQLASFSEAHFSKAQSPVIRS